MPLVKDFSLKARYPLDLGAAKPVKRRSKRYQSGTPELGSGPGKADMSDKAKAKKATLDRHVILAAHQMAE